MLLCGFVAFTYLRSANDRGTGWLLVGQVGTTAVFLIGGASLILGQRWAWPLGLIAAFYCLGFGIHGVAAGEANPYIATYILLIIPGGLILIGLITPRSRSWLRGSGTPERDDQAA